VERRFLIGFTFRASVRGRALSRLQVGAPPVRFFGSHGQDARATIARVKGTSIRCKLVLVCAFLFALAICLARAQAEEVTAAFIAPTNSFVAGSRASVWLYLMNNSAAEIHRALDAKINAKFVAPPVSWDVVLHSASTNNEVTIAPGAFAKAEYFVDVPPALHGLASLSVSHYNEVAVRVAEVVGTNSDESPMVLEPARARPPRTALAKFFDNHLSPYEQIYFLIGNYPAAEFQLSLKFQLFDFTNSYAGVTNLYFAYTQTSYWDLISSDPSFFDTSYKPSIFLYFPGLLARKDKAIQLDLQGGVEHESNGRGGTEERSIYSAYLQPRITFGKPGHLQFALQPRAWTYFWVGHNNPDIAEFRGYADLHAFLTLKREPNSWANFQIETRFRIGDGGEHPGIQIDGRYKIPHFNPTIDVQYFDGYGQTLRQYNKEAHGLRVGLCLWYWPDYPTK
jgi:phospholipase A1/A2